MDPANLPTSTTNLMNLNDDCLREVFEFLELPDLCIVADVCVRFRSIARDHFGGSSHQPLKLHKACRNGETYAKCLQRIAAFFRNFEPFITSIDVSDIWNDGKLTWRNNISIIELIVRYLSETLRELKLRGFCGSDKFVQLISKLQVTKLDFDSTTYRMNTEDLLQLIGRMSHLRILRYKQIQRRTRTGICIGFGTYKKLLDMVGRRRDNTHLTIDLQQVIARYENQMRDLEIRNDNVLTLICRDRDGNRIEYHNRRS